MTGGLLVVSVVQQLHLPGQSVLVDFGGVVVTRVGGSGSLGSAGAEVGTDPGFPTPEYCCLDGPCLPQKSHLLLMGSGLPARHLDLLAGTGPPALVF